MINRILFRLFGLAVILFILSALVLGAAATGTRIAAVWQEVGAGSANGGGISANKGESGWPATAADSQGNVYVGWYDTSGVDAEIYVKYWNGNVWSEVGLNSASGGGISNNSGESKAVDLAVGPDDNPCAAWRDRSSGKPEIYLRCWDGKTWAEVDGSASGGGVSNQKGDADSWPSIDIDTQGRIFVAWSNKVGAEADYEVYVAMHDQTGWQWLGPGDGNVSNNNSDSYVPSLTMDSADAPYVAWQDESAPGSGEIYIRRWDGKAWIEINPGSATDGGVSNSKSHSERPYLDLDDGDVPYIAWTEDNGGNEEIYVRRWDGANWVEAGVGAASGGGISNSKGFSRQPDLLFAEPSKPCVIWYDKSSGNAEVYVRCWNGKTWAEVGDGSATGGGISDNKGASSLPSIAVAADGQLYAAWGDNSSGNYEIYVRRSEPFPAPPSTTTPTASSSATLTPTAPPTATSTPRGPGPGYHQAFNPVVIKNSKATPQPPYPGPGPTTPTPCPYPPCGPQVPIPRSYLPVVVWTDEKSTNTSLPLFSGLHATYAGEGYIRTNESYDVGTHATYVAGEVEASDTIRVVTNSWYDPNPRGWEAQSWASTYRVSTGDLIGSNASPDPRWKWGNPWLLPYRFTLSSGEMTQIGGQTFIVTGPQTGTGAFGQRVTFWTFSNRDKFLIIDDSAEVQQFVHPGEAILHYDVTTRLLLVYDVQRRIYFQGALTPYTIRYVDRLMASNAYPASIPLVSPVTDLPKHSRYPSPAAAARIVPPVGFSLERPLWFE